MWLNQPFPAYQFSWRLLRFSFFSGLSVFLILALLKPFNISAVSPDKLWLHAAYYGTVTFILVTLNSTIFPKLFPKVFEESRWTVGKEIGMMLWQILTIAIANVAVTHLLYGDAFSWRAIFNFLWITGVIGIFPITLIVLLKQQILLKKYAAEAAVLDQQLEATPVAAQTAVPVQEAVIVFMGDNQNENLQVPVKDVRFIAAADNYIKVHFIRDTNPTIAVLRSTLKKAETIVQDYPQFFRCHRTYMVNLAAVTHVSGNAQGYKLHLKDVAEPIPVSRNLNNDLTSYIEKHNPSSHLSQ